MSGIRVDDVKFIKNQKKKKKASLVVPPLIEVTN